MTHEPRIARRLKRVGAGFALAGLLFLAMQAGIRWGANYYLREKARLPVRIGRLVINPANSRVSISVAGEKPAQVLNLDLGAIRLDWWDIFFKRLRVGQIHMEGLRLDIAKDANGRMIIGGILLPAATSTAAASSDAPPAPASDSHPWGLGVGGIDLRDVHLDYHDPLMNLSVVIHQFHMDPAESWHAEAQTPFEGDLSVNGGRVHLSGRFRPFRTDPSLDTMIQVTALPLAWLGPVLKHSKLDGTIDATLTVDGLEIHPTSAGPAIRLRGLELRDTRLAIMDRTFRPPFHWNVESIGLKLADINTADTRAIVPFSLNIRISRHETLALTGRWAPWATIPDGKLDLAVEGFNLTPFSPFVEHKTSYRMASGKLTLKTNATLDHGALASNTKVDAQTLYLNKLRAEDQDATMESIGLPLGLGLALLRDADDHIRLEVPIKGDLSDPKVPIGRLVWTFIGKALAAAIRNAAMAFFPGGGQIGFKPVTFAAGEPLLTPEAQSYLTELGQNMTKRPQVSIKLGASVTPPDYYALVRKKPESIAVPFNWEALRPEVRARLRALGDARAQAVQDFLTQSAGINTVRLSAKQVKEDSAPQTIPRVDIGF